MFQGKNQEEDSYSKMWRNLGHVRSSLTNSRRKYFDTKQNKYIAGAIDPTLYVVEYELVPVKRTKASDLYERMLRKDKFIREFGNSVAKLLDKLDNDGKLQDYTWCIAIKEFETGLVTRVNKSLKKMQVEKNVDYVTNNHGTWVFRDKKHAMTAKLFIGKPVVTLDLVDYLEKKLED